MVKYAKKDRDKTLLNRIEVFQCKLRFIELPVEEYILDNALHMAFYPFRRRVLEHP